MVRRVGYCLSCGMLRELDGGICRQCRKDDAVRAARRGAAPKRRCDG